MPNPLPYRRWLPTWLVLGLIACSWLRLGFQKITTGQVSTSPALWKVGQPRAMEVERGRAQFQVPSPEPGSSTLVIVSSLAPTPGPYPLKLTARTTGKANFPKLASRPKPTRIPISRVALPAVPPPARSLPRARRVFHILARDGDVASASNYLAITGELGAFGERIQVYIDPQDRERVSTALLQEIVETFDLQVFPMAARTIGQAHDSDGDGRFTILLSSWLTRLAGGRHSVDGFVRGADLDPEFAAPFSNQCDMMYLNANLSPGPYLKTILAHEYTHAVTYSAKTFTGPKGERLGLDEEGWLDEALAHLCEDLHGFSRSNLDYRISAFLSNPERYQLVVDDYYSADLFRSHGNRGSTYLFLRWCADRFGEGLLPALIRSDQVGQANLERVTGMPFDDLYRQWSQSLYLTGIFPRAQNQEGPGFNVRAECDGWELSGPRTMTIKPDDQSESWTTSGTSSHYMIIQPSSTGIVDIEVTGPEAAEVQVTAVPLPADLPSPKLQVAVERTSKGDYAIKAQVSQEDKRPLELVALAWEPLVPPADPHAVPFRRGKLSGQALKQAFGTTELTEAQAIASRPIELEGVTDASSPLIIKAIVTDSKGRRVAAWAEVNLE